MRELPLGDVLESVIDHRGKTPKKLGGDFIDAGVPVVSAIHIKDGRINWEERYRFVSPDMFRKWMPERLRKGDLLLTSEAPLGEVALVPSDDDLVLSQRLFALRGRVDMLDTSYLRYFFGSPLGRQRLQERATGTTVLGIRQSELMKVLVPVPPLEQQRAIVGVLGALDDLVENCRRTMSDLAAVTNAIWEQAQLSATESRNFGELATLAAEKCDPTRIDPATPYLGLEHFVEGGGGLNGLGTADGSESMKAVFRAGDILYGKLRPYFRKIARPNFDGVCSTEVWVIRPAPGVSGDFLEWVVGSQGFSDFAMAGSGGTRMPRASWSHVSRMPVHVPDAYATAAAAKGASAVRDQYWSLWSVAREAADARDELLPLLLTGLVTPGEVAA